MNELPRQILRQILAKHGKEICSDARRCENLLRDLCGSYRREINVLINALEQHIPLDLLAANRSMPLEVLFARLEKRLEEQTALTPEAARWAVETWALALDLVTENEIRARQKRIESANPPRSKTETSHPNDSGGYEIPNANRKNPARPPKMPTPVPPSRINPPVIGQPAKTSPKTSPVIFPANNQKINPPNAQTKMPTQPVKVRKGFGIFRGCLLIIFLLAVTSIGLLFGVPYAIDVMRETQRQRNSEPPRFPVR